MKSMTGMGRSQGTVQDTTLKIEIKSVNHRYCEVGVRLPSRLSFLEIPIQQIVKSLVARGKIDIFVTEERSLKPTAADLGAYRACYEYLDGVRRDLKILEPLTLSHLLGLASGWVQKDVDADRAIQEFEPILKTALTDLDAMRAREGSKLKSDIAARFVGIDRLRADVATRAGGVAEDLQRKLSERLNEKMPELSQIDPQRLHTEVIFYLDRLDISEELERLVSHLQQAQHFLELPEAVGRKLDFLLQEINREFNTIASKSQNTGIAHAVVDAKVELEKIREQIQNIE